MSHVHQKRGRKRDPRPGRSAQPRPPASGPRLVSWVLVAAALAGVVWAAYRSALGHTFVDWDDGTYVGQNTAVLGKRYGELLRAVVSHNFHPLTMLSMAWNASTPLTARPFIATNVAFHALNTVLVFWLVSLLSKRRLLVATFAAMVFGIHPMHVESVAWISERKDVLYACFYLGGLIAYWRYLERRTAWLLGVAFACFAASCVSKGMAVSFPLAMVLLDFWKRRPLLEPRALVEKLPFFAVALVFGLIAVDVQSGGNFHGLLELTGVGTPVLRSSMPVTPLQRLTLPTYGYLMYAWRLFVPTGLCAFDPYPTPAEANRLPFLLAPVFLLATLALAVWDARRTRVLAFGIGWYLATVALVLQWVPVGQAIMADRYTYVPYVGPAFALGMGIQSAFERNHRIGTALWCAAGVFAVALFVLTTRQVAYWKDGETLWTRAIDVHPGSAHGFVNRGGCLVRSGRIAESRSDFQNAIRLGDQSAGLYNGLGCVFGAEGKQDSALIMFDRALRIDPSEATSHYDRALALLELGRAREALPALERALALSPALAPAVLGTRGTVHMEAGEYRDALADLDRAIAAGLSRSPAFYARGVSRLRLGDRDGAVADFREALRLSPPDGRARAQLHALGVEAP